MFKIDYPHPACGREFETWAHAARFAVCFGIPLTAITETEDDQ